ncbi:pyruvate kinase [Hymenobacter actinosclerus]|uniref:pyruvate kinase n=1 Tax=Hymenobacter actinosclerus TaxID=82805 RepID=A0A1I0DWZ7_9BACT|nr:pyruvate kinase [Hymenobacter actinosclerus]SET36391.1 pyruvate kinase [Hymenobacter actinosclerus]
MSELVLYPPYAHRHAPALTTLLAELTALRADMLALAGQATDQLQAVHPNFGPSARNLLHYLALRQHDRRDLQQRLAALGLSSLGRAEAHALATVEAVLAIVQALLTPAAAETDPDNAPDFESGPRLLAEHSDACLGPAPAAHSVRIMVTMPGEAATNYELVRELLREGMNCMRINCAHDDAAAWGQMIAHLRRAEQELGKTCRVSMDLAGPKLRTQGLPPAPAVLKVKPHRDARGRVLAPARLWLTAQEQPQPAPAAAAATLAFPAAWLLGLRPGSAVLFEDARGARRKLRVVGVEAQGCWAELRKTAYITPLTRFLSASGAAASPDALPAKSSFLLLRPGDLLQLVRQPLARRAPPESASGAEAKAEAGPAVIGCTLPEVLDSVQPGEHIWFDDGKIGGVAERVEAQAVHVRISQARAEGDKLRNDKGINLPDSQLAIPALTEKDLQDLVFIARHADVVELSFVNSPADITLLRQQLAQLTDRVLPIVLKIETRRGFEQLPALLLRAMQAESCGVMIARGDLAVECGFERLAEVQEEILWLCEAAHVPVIWATQVLESLAGGGMPARAEITDAAMGSRAECVMLNKGPRIVAAVQTLGGILRRMEAHQSKKSALLRSLHVAGLWRPQ